MAAQLDQTVRAALSEGALRFLDSALPANLIDGAAAEGVSDQSFDVVDPGTGQVALSISEPSAAQVAAAVAAAREAFDDGRWSRLDPTARQEKLGRLVELVERDRRVLAELESFDTGKPVEQAEWDITECLDVLRYFTGWVDKVEGTVPSTPQQFFATAVREPLGVCGAITPWNYPLPLLTYKLAPALAFGNTFVAKPSELASLSTLYLSGLVSEAGIPDGVVNVVAGGAAVGAALAADRRIDKLAFTGSTATGTAIMHAAADNLTRVTLELGGKSAHIVFPDADLDAAATAVLEGIWTNAGQLCVAGSRLVVHADIAEEFTAELARRTSGLVLGHGLHGGTDVGPLISARQHRRVQDMLDAAIAQGAHPSYRPEVGDRPGFFLSPVILTEVSENDTIAQTEIFGPVLSVLEFKDEADAIRIANATPYGLAAGLWTRDVGRVHRMSRRLRAGTIWVNTYGVFLPTVPFGGVKASGMGRELGSSALDHYTDVKSVITKIDE